MNNNRLGFITASGLIAAALAILIMAGFVLVQGGTLFSPGELSNRSGAPINGVTSHAAIGGQCSLCHAPIWSSTGMADRCTSCHTDVASQWTNASSLHGILHKYNPAVTCFTCHPDHIGTDSPVTVMNLNTFPHTTVEYSLNTHQLKSDGTPFVCSDCHAQNFITFDKSVCTTCHTQINAAFIQTHLQDFGPTCLSCHDGVDSFDHNFSHNNVSYQLIGKHAQVECGQCHLNARNIADLKSTPQDCASCHDSQDAHQRRLGTDCASCHTPAGWTPAKFDHNLATFTLQGLHINVTCTVCHVNNIYHGTPSDCYSCHEKSDPHNGQFGSTDCATCHTSAGWTPSTYNHALSSLFTLTGLHANVPCTNCHTNNVYKATPTTCSACHAKTDPHGGQFGAADCGSCHTTSGWTPSTFNHNLASFKLAGQHASVPCTSCHVNNVYKGTSADCNSCHQKDNTHGSQFGSTSCGSCHTTSGWTPASFDHNLASFKLTGSHISVSCSGCHTNNAYTGTPSDCYSCHKQNDTHGGQFGTNCAQCHSTSGWTPASFDHNLASFKLTGQHVNVACTSCHINNNFTGIPTDCFSCHQSNDTHNGQFGNNCASCHTTSAWSPSTFVHSAFALTGGHSSLACSQCHGSSGYSGLSTACVSCHAEPSVHAGQFGTDCASCHTTNNWNATFNHPRSCDGDCLNHHRATCADCHPVNYTTYTCTKCHDSNKPGG